MSDIHIHPNDTGFLYGEGVYDVVPFIDHTPLWLDAHIRQWTQSLKDLAIQSDHNWHDIIWTLTRSAKFTNGYIYLQASSGPLDARSMTQKGTNPTIIAQPMALPEMPSKISAMTVDDNVRCATRNHKHTSKYITRKILSQNPNTQEIIYSHLNTLLEGGSSNIFMIKENQLITPPPKLIYPGITRQCVLDIAVKNNIKISISPIDIRDIGPTDGLFLTGSIKRCLPITQLNDIKICIPDLFLTIKKLYNTACDTYVSQYKETA